MSFPVRWAVALIRIALGIYFVADAWDKTRHHWFTNGRPMAAAIRANLSHASGFYRPFLESTVLPHARLFSFLVVLGEWSAGISLLVGLITGLGAMIVIALMVNTMLMKGLTNVMGSDDRFLFGISLLLILTSAGSIWGLDALIWQRVRPASGRHVVFRLPARPQEE